MSWTIWDLDAVDPGNSYGDSGIRDSRRPALLLPSGCHGAVVVMPIVIDVVACVIIADFLSGFFHWLEDAYGQEHWPITGRHITLPNIRHHQDPAYFTRHSWFETARVLLVMSAAILAGAWTLGLLSWHVLLVVAIGVNANEIHKWAHRSRRQNGRLIAFLQSAGLLQSPGHHARHHRGTRATHYCVVTNYLNPLLDRIRVWRALERLVFLTTGARRRPDHSINTCRRRATA